MEKWNPTDAERTRFKEWVAGMKELNRIVDEERRRMTLDQRLDVLDQLTRFADSMDVGRSRDTVGIEKVRETWGRLKAGIRG